VAIEPSRLHPSITGARIGVLTPAGYAPCAVGARAPHRSDRIERASPWYAGPDLGSIEGNGTGHTLRRHVGIGDAALRERAETVHHDASTFPDRATAQLAVERAFAENQHRIASWLARGSRGTLAIGARFDEPVGRVFRYDRQTFEPSHNALVVLKRFPAAPQGYTVITAYPR
jgi:hypothetical protein